MRKHDTFWTSFLLLINLAIFLYQKFPSTFVILSFLRYVDYTFEILGLFIIVLLVYYNGRAIFENHDECDNEEKYALKLLGIVFTIGVFLSLDLVLGTYSDVIARYESEKTENKNNYNRFSILDFLRLPINQLLYSNKAFENDITLNELSKNDNNITSNETHYLILDKTLSTPNDTIIQEQIDILKASFLQPNSIEKFNRIIKDVSIIKKNIHKLSIGELTYLYSFYSLREDNRLGNINSLLYFGEKNNMMLSFDDGNFDASLFNSILSKPKRPQKTNYFYIFKKLNEKINISEKKSTITLISDFLNEDTNPNKLKKELIKLHPFIKTIRIILIPKKNNLSEKENDKIEKTKLIFREIFSQSVEFEEIYLSEVDEVNKFNALNAKVIESKKNNEIFTYCGTKYNSSIRWDSCIINLKDCQANDVYITLKSNNEKMIKGRVEDNLLLPNVPLLINKKSFKLSFPSNIVNAETKAELEIYIPNQSNDKKLRILVSFLPLLSKKVAITWIIAMILMYTSTFIYLFCFVFLVCTNNNSMVLSKTYSLAGLIIILYFYCQCLCMIQKLSFWYALPFIGLIILIFTFFAKTIKKQGKIFLKNLIRL